MNINTEMQGRPLYMKTTDVKGSVTHSEHVVWDAGLFLQARLNEAKKANEGYPGGVANAEAITLEQFKARA
jgi:hypothetical protein